MNSKIPKITINSIKPHYIPVGVDIDLFALFQVIEQESQTCFLLESLGPYSDNVRYSVVGFEPDFIVRGRGQELWIGDQKFQVKNPYYELRKILPISVIAQSYAGGLVGYIGYEAANYFEPTLDLELHPLFDQFRLGVYTDGIILDKMTNEVIYFYYNQSRLDLVKGFIEKANSLNQSATTKVRFIRHTSTKAEHREVILRVKEHIKAGNTFQCEVGFKSEYEIQGEVLPIYQRLRAINPTPYMCYLKFGNQKLIGNSPELCMRLRDGEIDSFPLAGTTWRDADALKDAALARTLLKDVKEQAEHKMLVDLHRNDLGRVSKFGTVKVRSLMDIKKFSHVQHISSDIVGVLRDDKDMFDVFAATFPIGTLTGAPKIESMKIIAQNEQAPRGPYGGGSGVFGFNGDCAFAVNIRSLFVDGNYAYGQTCGGVVYDSDPEREYEEVMRKLGSMSAALECFY